MIFYLTKFVTCAFLCFICFIHICFTVKYLVKNQIFSVNRTESTRQIYIKYFTIKISVKHLTFSFKLSRYSIRRHSVPLTLSAFSLSSSPSPLSSSPSHKPEPPSHSQVCRRHSSPAVLIAGSTLCHRWLTRLHTSTHRVWFSHSNPPILFII